MKTHSVVGFLMVLLCWTERVVASPVAASVDAPNAAPVALGTNVADDVVNNAPQAECQDLTRDADANCEAQVSAEEFDDGSEDRDDDPLMFTVDKEGPYKIGVTNVILTVSDGTLTATCDAIITVNESPLCSDGGGSDGGGKNPLFLLIYMLFAWLKSGHGIFKIIDYFKGFLHGQGHTRRRVVANDLPTKGTTTTLVQNPTATQKDVQTILGHMEDGTSFSVSTLRSLYVFLLSGLDLDGTSQDDLELLVEDALNTIDLNGDGSIDASEMDQLQLPRETGEFLFEDVVAYTLSNFQTATGDACVTPDNVIDFLNQFYADTEVVSANMAQQIREKSGSDA